MKTKIAIIAAAIALSSSAFAATPNVTGGTVEFQGLVQANSCTISVNGGGADETVVLSNISVGEFAAANTLYKQTPFSITASKCGDAAGSSLKATWDNGDGVDGINSYLSNVAAGGAENVKLVISKDGTFTAAVVPGKGERIAPTSSTEGSAVFTFQVGYVAPVVSDSVKPTAGPVLSHATYSINYN